MASEQPRLILRNATIFVDRISRVGQAREVTLPTPEVTVEEFCNAGMIKARDVNLGYSKLEASFVETAFDPAVIGLFGLAPGVVKDFLVTGALVDEDGTTTSAVAYLRGFLRQFDPGAWEAGSKAETTFNLSVHEFKLEIGGRSIIEMDDFDIKVNGVSQYQSIRNALLL
ncbi:phage major tail tube protein [Pseudochelatococcus sp. G4_1912]|uniref:phage major tail tube protein n=1 Tax=Pseudochelatococcus sp. G4_1912 TaxID=3114288 RepID=UPI0039C650E6